MGFSVVGLIGLPTSSLPLYRTVVEPGQACMPDALDNNDYNVVDLVELASRVRVGWPAGRRPGA